MSQLDFHREMHRRIAIIPASTYPHKVKNLRWIGRKVDILEAEAAGQLTREQAARKLAEEDAEMEAAEEEARKARIRSDFDRAEAVRAQQEQAAAQAEAQRRAIGLQLLQNQMNQRPAYQPVTPYQIPVPRQTNCTSQWIGNTWHTVCR